MCNELRFQGASPAQLDATFHFLEEVLSIKNSERWVFRTLGRRCETGSVVVPGLKPFPPNVVRTSQVLGRLN